jgi:hypothetical protein
MNRRQLLLHSWTAGSFLLLGCTRTPEMTKHPAPATVADEGSSRPTLPIAVTSMATGKVMLLDRDKLDLIRTVEPDKPGRAPGPMLGVEDKVRRAFDVGHPGMAT